MLQIVGRTQFWFVSAQFNTTRLIENVFFFLRETQCLLNGYRTRCINFIKICNLCVKHFPLQNFGYTLLRLRRVITQKTTILPPCKPQILYIFVCSVGYSDGLRDDQLGFGSRQGQNVSLLSSLQTGSGAHPASCPMGTVGLLPRE
jgi:hypothetical protein